MNEHRRSFLAIVALVSSSIAGTYFASYFILVMPSARLYVNEIGNLGDGPFPIYGVTHYRADGPWPEQIFLPLEAIDRSLRPAAWQCGVKTDRSLRSQAPGLNSTPNLIRQ